MPQPINEFIDAHLQWTSKLSSATYGGEIPDRSTAGVDNACDLGKWIYGEGGTLYGSHKEFTELKEKHRQFHLSVGQVIDMIQAGRKEEARHAVTEGEFLKISGTTINLLSKLRLITQGR